MDQFTSTWQSKIQYLENLLEKSGILSEAVTEFDSSSSEALADYSKEIETSNYESESSPSSSTSGEEQIIKVINYDDFEENNNQTKNLQKSSTFDANKSIDSHNQKQKSKNTTIDWITALESIKINVSKHLDTHIKQIKAKQQIQQRKSDARREFIQKIRRELDNKWQILDHLLHELEKLS